MIITVGNIKGGVGKTTLAVNLAIHAGKNLGKSVVLIDADDQSTATLFTEIREQESEPATTPASASAAARSGARAWHWQKDSTSQ